MSQTVAIQRFSSIQPDGYEPQVSIGTTYAVAGPIEFRTSTFQFSGVKLGNLYLFLETLSAANQKITFRITSDELGDWLVASNEGDETTVITGLDDSGNGTVVYPLDQTLYKGRKDSIQEDTRREPGIISLYLWLKLDSGTADLDDASLTYQVFV